MALEPHELPPNSEREKLAFEREKWEAEQSRLREDLELRREELALKRLEARRSTWWLPVFIAIGGASIAAVGSTYVSLLNNRGNLELEKQKDEATLKLERDRAEATRILEIIKAGNPSQATNNLRFLLTTKLISTPDTVAGINAYLDSQPRGSGPAFLPPSIGPSIPRPKYPTEEVLRGDWGLLLSSLDVKDDSYTEHFKKDGSKRYPDRDHVFIVINFRLHNLFREARAPDFTSDRVNTGLLDDRGISYRATSWDVAASRDDMFARIGTPILPSASAEGALVFAIPKDRTPSQLRFTIKTYPKTQDLDDFVVVLPFPP